ncbi:NAD(P)H-dependent glycerol-3-phosphate dehydrogenase [Sphingomonas nostoxanthinifaciens]|uniref:NAD(P)H-dependent glycerol-3-phosphate dehydrogenase n=1 Tax=Sphingomonas nostoxanthinifaciens TaxID=2872652 RepID=UPI001CC21E85|nr:NAD(P)H-dependent glycerol-3-phosphate dehydrogenase [Sphingomonas nostoxanthinifaciens]UAK24546.1 NAD(P)-dependent glycerol-3-phosphate dehydrogenase [Sphingomonas nostoxanthinifaciens]
MRIGVIGAGAWGTALAQVAAQNGEVLLWARDPALAAAIVRDRENAPYLPGIALSPRMETSADLADLASADALLAVAPAQHLRGILRRTPVGARPLLLCAKGVEAGTMALMSEMAAEECPVAPIAVLSGPTFAGEVAAGLPTAVTLAVADPALGKALAARLALPAFRPYHSTDVIGAEIGGAVKNVLAIACGVVDGAGLGRNARAALIARGFAEMTRFGLARGAQAETLAGLSGLGDLVLTCSSEQSRNYSLGLGLGRGASATSLLTGRRTVAEGASTAPVLVAAAQAAGVEMPIAEAVATLLAGTAGIRDVVDALLSRPIRSERL